MADEEPRESESHEEEEPRAGLLYLLHRNESSFRFANDLPGIVLKGLLESFEEREKSVKEEHDAAVAIQCSARRMLCGIAYGHDRKAAISLERLYRGHLGRLAFEVKQAERDAQVRRAFWDCNATLVQKLWRGFHSRKHAHNFYLRKAYLTSVMTRGLEIRSELEAHYRNMSEMEEIKMEQEKIDKFEDVVGSLHHMLSTASCSGVYNSPYVSNPQTAFGLPIESHLRNVAKGTLRETILRFGSGKTDKWTEGKVNLSDGTAQVLHVSTAGGQLYAYSTKPMKISRSD
uniref:Uncharacterized protein n=1 Tax=Hanusia phi TaxID=3032 RepID=A0A7S0EK24_9CRYP|mmetsp:Transcript_26212/g.59445  ORF Transcript_26212/g.59445 Transcript_26212/m.59445 type:complete len:288 (+) Transcript_26212:259-1122(+)